jgi:cell division protein FtsX
VSDDRRTALARLARLSTLARPLARGCVALLVAVAVLWLAFHLR